MYEYFDPTGYIQKVIKEQFKKEGSSPRKEIEAKLREILPNYKEFKEKSEKGKGI